MGKNILKGQGAGPANIERFGLFAPVFGLFGMKNS